MHIAFCISSIIKYHTVLSIIKTEITLLSFYSSVLGYDDIMNLHNISTDKPPFIMMTSSQKVLPTKESLVSSPSRKEVDAALKYILSKTTSKKGDIASSPTSIVIPMKELDDKRNYYPSMTCETIPSRSEMTHSSFMGPDPQRTSCFDLTESYPAQVMTEWLRLSFSSQVSFKHNHGDGSKTDVDS